MNDFMKSKFDDTRIIKKILSYMRGNTLGKVVDFSNGILVIIFLIYAKMFMLKSIKDIALTILILIGIISLFVCFHFIIRYFNENRIYYVELLISNSQDYCNFCNYNDFLRLLQDSLRNYTILQTRRLIITKDFVLTTIGDYDEFNPIVIERKNIIRDSFYIEKRWNFDKRTRSILIEEGILELEMKDGKLLKLFVSEGNKNKNVLKLLDFVKETHY